MVSMPEVAKGRGGTSEAGMEGPEPDKGRQHGTPWWRLASAPESLVLPGGTSLCSCTSSCDGLGEGHISQAPAADTFFVL